MLFAWVRGDLIGRAVVHRPDQGVEVIRLADSSAPPQRDSGSHKDRWDVDGVGSLRTSTIDRIAWRVEQDQARRLMTLGTLPTRVTMDPSRALDRQVDSSQIREHHVEVQVQRLLDDLGGHDDQGRRRHWA